MVNPSSISIIFINMSSFEPVPPPAPQPTRKARKCSICKLFGHDKRNCTAVHVATDDVVVPPAVPDPEGLQIASPKRQILKTAGKSPSDIDWDKVYYVVFDL
jgi:hypothetical protein